MNHTWIRKGLRYFFTPMSNMHSTDFIHYLYFMILVLADIEQSSNYFQSTGGLVKIKSALKSTYCIINIKRVIPKRSINQIIISFNSLQSQLYFCGLGRENSLLWSENS